MRKKEETKKRPFAPKKKKKFHSQKGKRVAGSGKSSRGGRAATERSYLPFKEKGSHLDYQMRKGTKRSSGERGGVEGVATGSGATTSKQLPRKKGAGDGTLQKALIWPEGDLNGKKGGEADCLEVWEG